jgi:hypothetical protein
MIKITSLRPQAKLLRVCVTLIRAENPQLANADRVSSSEEDVIPANNNHDEWQIVANAVCLIF